MQYDLTTCHSIVRVFYAAVSETSSDSGSLSSGAGIYLTLQQGDDDPQEVFTGSFYLGNCEPRIAELQACGCALLLLSSLLCSPPSFPGERTDH